MDQVVSDAKEYLTISCNQPNGRSEYYIKDSCELGSDIYEENVDEQRAVNWDCSLDSACKLPTRDVEDKNR